jgi:hypothetical protein
VGDGAPTRSQAMMRDAARHPVRFSQALAGDETTVDTAVDWAEVAAMLGDYREAVSWLVYVEWLQGSLTPELEELRARWERAAGPLST